jgi:hypothetical protein
MVSQRQNLAHLEGLEVILQGNQDVPVPTEHKYQQSTITSTMEQLAVSRSIENGIEWQHQGFCIMINI